MKQIDRSTMEMALIGYEAERQRIKAVMAAIRKQVDGRVAAPANVPIVGQTDFPLRPAGWRCSSTS